MSDNKKVVHLPVKVWIDDDEADPVVELEVSFVDVDDTGIHVYIKPPPK